jgi:hypothetical protein
MKRRSFREELAGGGGSRRSGSGKSFSAMKQFGMNALPFSSRLME